MEGGGQKGQKSFLKMRRNFNKITLLVQVVHRIAEGGKMKTLKKNLSG